MSNTTTARPETPTEFEAAIDQEVRKTPGLSFGYIGNFERWGDDRSLYIWIPSLPRQKNGNTQHLWSATAKSLSRQEYCDALRKITAFRLGAAYAATAAASV